ncbi:16S rRNA (uracil(1498)-N(3))-methyltransferase [Saxibacter everestensis]|uniref:Ribosomal RNA small subunit methyltransferase E n=1 Tax=Saxibacter everestensis TaxID=2909229 RepID=A0ABY8QXU9_9MICO|nr:16S rRNA (uracil(1498)-N(3))-methyltransferase [Brevibacteriaceae bacterium ZFBP1038]
MTAPLFYSDELPSGVERGDSIGVGGEVAHHAVRVRRIAPGESIILSDGAGLGASCSVLRADPDRMSLSVDAVVRETPADQQFVLVQSLAKADRDLQAIESATEIGADAIIPLAAQRSIVSWPAKRAAKSQAKWKSTVRAAAQQSRRLWLPKVLALHTPKQLAALIADQPDVGAVVLHEDATLPFATFGRELKARQSGQTLLIVGPEGGFGDEELELFTAAGATTAKLGPHVLRSSTAGPVALSVLLAAIGRWD